MDKYRNLLIILIYKPDMQLLEYAVRFDPAIFGDTYVLDYYLEPENKKQIFKKLIGWDDGVYEIVDIRNISFVVIDKSVK